jgi:hypothetical protein
MRRRAADAEREASAVAMLREVVRYELRAGCCTRGYGGTIDDIASLVGRSDRVDERR